MNSGLNAKKTLSSSIRVISARSTKSFRGSDRMRIVEVSVDNCSAVISFSAVDGDFNAAILAEHINSLRPDTAIVGVVAFDVCFRLSATALAAWRAIGVDIDNRCGMGHTLAFVAVIGQPSRALMKIGRVAGDEVMINMSLPVRGIQA